MMQYFRRIAAVAVAILLTVGICTGIAVSLISADELPRVEFTVPETVWLGDGNGLSNPAKQNVYKFSNVLPDGTVDPAAPVETQGYVYFTPAAGMDSPTLSVTYAADGADQVAGLSGEYSAAEGRFLLSGNLNTTVPPGEVLPLRYDVRVLYKGDVLTYTAWGMAYAPPKDFVGAGADIIARYSSGNIQAESSGIFGLQGVHAFTGTAGAGTTVYSTSNALWTLITTPSSFSNTARLNAYDYVKGAQGEGWANLPAKTTLPTNVSETAVSSGLTGILRLDTSRFAEADGLSKVPGLRLMFWQIKQINNANKYSSGSAIKWGGTQVVNLNGQSGQQGNYYSYSTYSTAGLAFPTDLPAEGETLTCAAKAILKANNVSFTLTLDLSFRLLVERKDKSVLRSAVSGAVKYPNEWLDNPAVFHTALQEAATVLGNPASETDACAVPAQTLLPAFTEPEPTTEPTATEPPTVPPTEPSSESSTATVPPTEPSSESSMPTVPPTEPSSESSATTVTESPTEQPTEPSSESSTPTVPPTEPPTAPTEPPTEPSAENTTPTEPSADNVTPASDSDAAVQENESSLWDWILGILKWIVIVVIGAGYMTVLWVEML
jgi:hypothetical protein